MSTNTNEAQRTHQADEPTTQRRPYEAPSIQSEPLFESVAAAQGKSTATFECGADSPS